MLIVGVHVFNFFRLHDNLNICSSQVYQSSCHIWSSCCEKQLPWNNFLGSISHLQLKAVSPSLPYAEVLNIHIL